MHLISIIFNSCLLRDLLGHFLINRANIHLILIIFNLKCLLWDVLGQFFPSLTTITWCNFLQNKTLVFGFSKKGDRCCDIERVCGWYGLQAFSLGAK